MARGKKSRKNQAYDSDDDNDNRKKGGVDAKGTPNTEPSERLDLDTAGEDWRIIVVDDTGYRLDQYVAHRLSITRTRVGRAAKAGSVLVDGKPAKASSKLRVGQIVKFRDPPRPALTVAPEDHCLDILFEDDDVLVVNKPAGMAVHPAGGLVSGTLVNALLFHWGHPAIQLQVTTDPDDDGGGDGGNDGEKGEGKTPQFSGMLPSGDVDDDGDDDDDGSFGSSLGSSLGDPFASLAAALPDSAPPPPTSPLEVSSNKSQPERRLQTPAALTPSPSLLPPMLPPSTLEGTAAAAAAAEAAVERGLLPRGEGDSGGGSGGVGTGGTAELVAAAGSANQPELRQGIVRPGIVHRLDRFTSGVMVVAKARAAHAHLHGQFANKTTDRIYNALACGRVAAATTTTTTAAAAAHVKNKDEVDGSPSFSRSRSETPQPGCTVVCGAVRGRIGRHPVDRLRMALLGPNHESQGGDDDGDGAGGCINDGDGDGGSGGRNRRSGGPSKSEAALSFTAASANRKVAGEATLAGAKKRNKALVGGGSGGGSGGGGGGGGGTGSGLRGKSAVTHFKVLEVFRVGGAASSPAASFSFLELVLETGRTHQIRVHCSSPVESGGLGMPLLGDDTYGYREQSHSALAGAHKLMQRQALHARTLGFTHPVTGARMHFEAPYPEDFRATLGHLRESNRK